MNIPRPEYPRPQMVRDGFINLNGEWDFEFDFGKSGRERKMYDQGEFSKKIVVPFCPESKLSGIEYVDFIPAIWYQRSFSVPNDWKNDKVFLHFGAVDYFCTVYINGKEVGTHSGGYTSFSFDVTDFLHDGENTVTVYAQDDINSGKQPRGKQSGSYYSQGCDYTRTTGIWQTVWLEKVPQSHIKGFKIYPDIGECAVDIEVDITFKNNAELTLEASFEGETCGTKTIKINGHTKLINLPLSKAHLWEVGNGRLYDLKLTLKSGDCTDIVNTYFGLREVTWDNNAMYLNGKRVFQRLVLDQGFYPDGVYTAPSDDALKNDIEISMALGFNGARLHEKIFEPRFLYHADKAGYLVWGEHGNWGLDIHDGEGVRNFLPEWLEAVARDFNHPAIIGWCPFNETWDGKQKQDDTVLSAVYQATKAADHTRPVIDTSGNFHVVTDIYDVHDYEQDIEIFKEHYAPMAQDGEYYETFPNRQKYGGQPYFVSEFGGAWWNKDGEKGGWGYGGAPESASVVADRYEGLTGVMLSNKNICAFCYTQLFDVEQEQNGLYTYEREKKFPQEVYDRILAANKRIAEIEK